MLTTKLQHRSGPGALLAGASCLINRHEPSGQKANWNGTHYVSRCEHCATPIRRVSQGKWVRDQSVIPHLHRPALGAR